MAADQRVPDGEYVGPHWLRSSAEISRYDERGAEIQQQRHHVARCVCGYESPAVSQRSAAKDNVHRHADRERLMKQLALCTWCKATWPVKDAKEADRWLRTHPCPKNPKETGRG